MQLEVCKELPGSKVSLTHKASPTRTSKNDDFSLSQKDCLFLLVCLFVCVCVRVLVFARMCVCNWGSGAPCQGPDGSNGFPRAAPLAPEAGEGLADGLRYRQCPGEIGGGRLALFGELVRGFRRRVLATWVRH